MTILVRSMKKAVQDAGYEGQLKPPSGESLALSRTRLANERTMLAYARTALSFFAAAAILLQFFDQNYYLGVAVVLMILALVIAVFGVYRFIKTSRELSTQQEFL